MNRIKLILYLIFFTFLNAQSPDELKKFMETYDKIKIDQQANNIVKEGIEMESSEVGPVKLLVTPSDIDSYYNEKIKSLKFEMNKLSKLLFQIDSTATLVDFGYNYFSLRDSINFLDNLKITPNYVLGFGDEVIISVWGQVEQYEKLIIQRDGSVYVSNVGLLFLSGKTLAEAKSYVNDKFSKVYSTINSKPQLTFVNISVGSVKNININISGHVKFPGNYIVSPSINVLNVIILAGGINTTGSLRSIYLIRNGVTIDSLDLYPIISGQSFSFDSFNLSDGDYLVVPAKGETISITGSVRMPGFYELKNDNIKTIMNYSGGKDRNALNKTYLYRNNGFNLHVSENNYDEITLLNGDSLVVPLKNINPKNISISIDNRQPFDIPWINNLTFEDIFDFGNINVSNIKKIEIVRRVDDINYETYLLNGFDKIDFSFEPYDFISIQLYNAYNKISTVYIGGYISSPGNYPLIRNNETLNTLIERAGGLVGFSSLSSLIIKRDSLIIGSSDGNILLTPEDSIIVNSVNATVTIEGSVHNPGSIQWIEDRTAKEYIELSGGLTAYGDKKHVTYIEPYGEAYRIKVNSRKYLSPGSKIIVSEKPSNQLDVKPDRFQQFSSLISSLVTIAILANSTSQ